MYIKKQKRTSNSSFLYFFLLNIQSLKYIFGTKNFKKIVKIAEEVLWLFLCIIGKVKKRTSVLKNSRLFPDSVLNNYK